MHYQHDDFGIEVSPVRTIAEPIEIKGENFVEQEYEPQDKDTEAYVATLADRLGLSRRNRPTSLRKVHRSLSDFLVAVRGTREGLICWSMKATDYRGAAYGLDIAKAVRDALLASEDLSLVQAPKRGLSAVYRAAVTPDVHPGEVRVPG